MASETELAGAARRRILTAASDMLAVCAARQDELNAVIAQLTEVIEDVARHVRDELSGDHSADHSADHSDHSADRPISTTPPPRKGWSGEVRGSRVVTARVVAP